MKRQLINLEPVRDIVRTKLLEKYDTTIFMNTSKVDISVDVTEILNEYLDNQQIITPSIFITCEAYVKMRTLVLETSTEIGWYGIVNKVDGLPNTYLIEDIIVYPQKVTGATCEQDEDKMFEFELSLTTEQVNHKRFHGHSHVNMSTGPSGVDEKFYQDILTQVRDYFIICINNKANSMYVRFYDIEHNVVYTDLPITVIQDDGVPIDDWYSIIKEKVSRPVATSYTGSSQGSLINSEWEGKYSKSFWKDDYDYEYDYDYPSKYTHGKAYDGDTGEELVWNEDVCGYVNKQEDKELRRAAKKVNKAKKKGGK